MNNEFNNQNMNQFESNNINSQNNKNDKWKDTLILILVIMVFVLTALSLYFVIGMKNNNLDGNKGNNQQENVNKEDGSIESVDFDEASLALDNFKKIYIDNEKLYNSNFEIKNITKKEIIGTAISNLDSKLVGFYGVGDNFESATNVSVQELMNILSKLIAIQEEINIEDIKTLCVNQENLCGDKIVEVEDNNVKVYNYPHGMSDEIVIYDKFLKAEKNKENLYVYMKTSFRKNGLTNIDKMTYTYYKDYNGSEMMEQIFVDDGKEPNWNLYDTYKYIFKIKNSNYYFEKIELIK